MMEISKDTDYTMESLFQEQIVLENFYAGAGRGDLLMRLKRAVENGVPLMVISGGEGSGKTMMCRMLENECPSSMISLFFSNTIESFEDVVKRIAKKLGLQLSAVNEVKTVDSAIEQIIAHLLQQSKGLLIIFDEAENIYLATLERIRKMLDRVAAAGVRIQIVFSGRKSFLENCEQLSICDFRNNEDLRFELLPLNEQETSEYLRICSERLPNPDKRKVFNEVVVRNIYTFSKGKIRKINFLADESLRSHGDDTSFMALLDDSGQDEVEAEDDNQEPVSSGVSRFIPYIWWIGGVLCTLGLLFFLLRPGEGRHTLKPVSLSSSAEKAKVEVIAEGASEQQPIVQPPAQEISQPISQPTEMAKEKSEQGEPKVAEEPKPDSPAIIEVSGVEEGKSKIVEQLSEPAELIEKKEIESHPAPVQNKSETVSDNKIPELRQSPSLKVKPGAPSLQTSGSVKNQLRAEAQESVGGSVRLTVDQLYQKRLIAGHAWESGTKNDKYTVQLMVLTAKNAELNLKKMLSQSNYRQEANNFVIFKNNGSPEVIFVFYGEYPTFEMAHIAQNSLPQFLRDHQPYAISIKGAVAKVGK
ncbi:MAG: AAA family ATPase [Pseudomonadota bacterium]